MAGAWPWVLAQTQPTPGRGRARLLAAGAGGFTASGLTTLALAESGLLRGPTLPGFTGAAMEALVLSGGATVLAVLLGMFRTTADPSGE